MRSGSLRSQADDRRSRQRRDMPVGFTLVELVTVMLVVAILVRIGLPRVEQAIAQARAAAVIGDFNVVRQAAYQYQAERLRWPPDSETGEIPPGLEDGLPRGFSFQRDHYQLDWEHWALPSSTPGRSRTDPLLGISVVTDDPRLARAVVTILGEQHVYFTRANTFTFILQ